MNGPLTDHGRQKIRTGQKVGAETKRSRTRATVLAAVARRGRHGTTSAGIVIATGLSKSTVRRTLAALIDAGQVGMFRDTFDPRVPRYHVAGKPDGT